jgi:hypothetical protein
MEITDGRFPARPNLPEETKRSTDRVEVQRGQGGRTGAEGEESLSGVSSQPTERSYGLEERSARVAEGSHCYCTDLGYRHGRLPSCSATTNSEQQMKPVKFTGITVLLVASILIFSGGAIVAVLTYNSRSQNNCEAIKGLRQDLVDVVRDSANRSHHSIIKAFPPGTTRKELLINLQEQTQRTLDKVGNPDCP